MTIDDLRSKRIGILGWGVNHRAMTAWLVRQGMLRLAVLDEGLTDAARDDALGISDWRFGPTAFDRLTDFDLIFRSPGIPLDHQKLAAARAAGVAVSSQTNLFIDQCPASIVGVTGTKGKGTTASLIQAILEQSLAGTGRRSFLAGNIGRDPFEFFDELTTNDWVVLELSSFQLEDLTTSPDIAVVLTIGEDHLNHHRSLVEYQTAKMNLVQHQGSTHHVVLALDDPVSRSFAATTPAHHHWFSRLQSVDDGVDVVGRVGEERFELVTASGRMPIIATTELKLLGKHNWENVAAALAASTLAGATVDAMQQAVRSFAPLPNRLEDLGTINGIRFVNDSYATGPLPTIAAIRSFDEPVILLLGGQGKGADYSELIREIGLNSIRVAVCYGTEGKEFQRLLEHAQNNRQIMYERSFDDAVLRAATVARTGEVVLLSPSATSFDQFRSYTERGDRFRQLVSEMTHGA